jgi:hypothetical protein
VWLIHECSTDTNQFTKCGSERKKSHDSFTGIIHAQGVELGAITDLSARMADGIALQSCLEMGGFSLRDAPPGQDVPAKLWRTLVGGRDSAGQPASELTRLAFLNLAGEISEHRSIDPSELLTSPTIRLEPYIRNFVARMRDVVWNRRVFKGKPWNSSSKPDSKTEELFGLAPQQARMNDKICLLYGCSVPVVLREQTDDPCSLFRCSGTPNIRAYYEIIGEAYVDGFMDGEAFEGEYRQEIESQAREFTLR